MNRPEIKLAARMPLSLAVREKAGCIAAEGLQVRWPHCALQLLIHREFRINQLPNALHLLATSTGKRLISQEVKARKAASPPKIDST